MSSKNEAIKADIDDFLSKRRGPGVGDLVVFQDGSSKRISHAWEDSVQLTREPQGGSFYVSNVGGCLTPEDCREECRRIP